MPAWISQGQDGVVLRYDGGAMHLLDLLFPKRCVSCQALDSYICRTCYRHIEYAQYQSCPVCMKPAIGGKTHPVCSTRFCPDGLFAAVSYRGPIKKAVRALKYRLVSDLGATLTDLLLSRYPDTMPSFDFLIPVPLHASRLRSRGFNQSDSLAKCLGKRLGVPVFSRGLIRIRNTAPQYGLSKKERKENIRGAFSLSPAFRVKTRSIAVIDDVVTTGVTLAECANVLKRQGAAVVWGIALAHG